jgi:required for meiotic nuclear division protein 1
MRTTRIPAAADKPVAAAHAASRLQPFGPDTRVLERDAVLGAALPLAIRLDNESIAVVFRYGAVVLFDCTPPATKRLLASLDPLLTDKLPAVEHDELQLLTHPDASQLTDAAGNII